MMFTLSDSAISTAATQLSSSTRVSVGVYSVVARMYCAAGAAPTSRPGWLAASSDQVAVPCACPPGSGRLT